MKNLQLKVFFCPGDDYDLNDGWDLLLLALQTLEKLELTVDQWYSRSHFGCALRLLLTHDKLNQKTSCLVSPLIWVVSQSCDISKLNSTVCIRIFFIFSSACSLFHPLRVVLKSWRLELSGVMSRLDMGKICFYAILDGPRWTSFSHLRGLFL